MSAQASCPVIPSQCSHWVVRRSVAEVSTRSVDGGIVVTPVPPPSVREVARSAGWRDVDPPHPRCSSVGADAHIRPPRPQARNTLAADCPKGYSAPRRGVPLPSAAKVPKNAVQTYGLKIPCAASLIRYLAGISHANAVPCKFHLNVALSLLLFSLPLLPWNIDAPASTVAEVSGSGADAETILLSARQS